MLVSWSVSIWQLSPLDQTKFLPIPHEINNSFLYRHSTFFSEAGDVVLNFLKSHLLSKKVLNYTVIRVQKATPNKSPSDRFLRPIVSQNMRCWKSLNRKVFYFVIFENRPPEWISNKYWYLSYFKKRSIESIAYFVSNKHIFLGGHSFGESFV